MQEELLELARRAGELLSSYYGSLSHADGQAKEGRRRDLVSEADLAAEELLLSEIPDNDSVLAEESGRRDRGPRTWIVDPLDGTVNFLHGIPFWSVSIAIAEDDQLLVGAICAPALGMEFAAEAGRGAFLNGDQIRVSECSHLADAILATGFPYARDTLASNNLDNLPRVGAACGGIRRFGSAAVDLALVASGRLDGFWELHLNAWDVAAGALILREAGGRVSDQSGNEELEAVLHGRNIVATNGLVHEKLQATLLPFRAEL